MWIGEVLQRQGWWVKKFPTFEEADDWVKDRLKAEVDSINQIRRTCTREFVPSGRVPKAPKKTFDESW